MRAGHFEISDSVMTPEELEFLAEEELITIIPKISTTEQDDAGRAGYLALLSGECQKTPDAMHNTNIGVTLICCRLPCCMHMRVVCNGMYLNMCIVQHAPATAQLVVAMMHIPYTCQLQAHMANSNQTSP